MSSEVGMGVEKIWHRDSDKMQSKFTRYCLTIY